MKKIAKLSLVAAVAVAGFTTANAQPLEEAIKNVDVSGSVVYRYNDYSNDREGKVGAGAETQSNNYKVGLNLSSKVNDDLKFNSRFLVASETGDFASLNYDGSNANPDLNGDSNVDAALSHVNFAYTGIKNTTVTVGKQGLATPWTVALDSDGNEQTGTGILAMTTVGPVTLAGAYFNQTNLDQSGDNVALFNVNKEGDEDIATAGAITTLGPVTLDAWYLDAQDIFDSYTVGAKAATELSGVKLGADARWASLEEDDADDKNTIAKIVLTADAGLVDGKLAYAKTGKDGGTTALDNDANTTLLGWSLFANGKADADYVQAVLGFDILSNLNLSANYGNVEWTPAANTTREQEEVYAQLLYKMSKNLTTYVRYGTYTDETTVAGNPTTEANDDTRGRLQVEYTF